MDNRQVDLCKYRIQESKMCIRDSLRRTESRRNGRCILNGPFWLCEND